MVSVRKLERFDEVSLVLPALLTLDQYYPNISDWFQRKVLLDSSGNSIAIGAFESDTLVGFLLAKRGIESKLRCVRVAESHQNSGLGIKLLEHGMELLGCEKPLITVAEELLGQYSRIFVNRYGYSLDQVVKGFYRRGKLEYVFNGEL